MPAFIELEVDAGMQGTPDWESIFLVHEIYCEVWRSYRFGRSRYNSCRKRNSHKNQGAKYSGESDY
jgi:hypothetical protein